MEPLTEEQVQFVINRMSEWIRVKQKFEYPEDKNAECPIHADRYTDYRPTSADVDHSSLLLRLLRGKDSLTHPPPIRFAYPDYNLAEGKEVEILDITNTSDGVIIDQRRSWVWEDKERSILKHIPTNCLYHYWTEIGYRKTEPPRQVTYTRHLLKKISDHSRRRKSK